VSIPIRENSFSRSSLRAITLFCYKKMFEKQRSVNWKIFREQIINPDGKRMHFCFNITQLNYKFL